jgi:hypothetical protein
MEWAQVLVIILSVFLAIFLLLGIVLVVLLIKVTRQIKSVAGAAERTALKFESVAGQVAAISSPLAIAKTIADIVIKARSKKK